MCFPDMLFQFLTNFSLERLKVRFAVATYPVVSLCACSSRLTIASSAQLCCRQRAKFNNRHPQGCSHVHHSICQASRAELEREKLWSESPLHSERNVRTGPTPSSGRRLHMTCVMSRCLFSCHLPSQISPSVQPW